MWTILRSINRKKSDIGFQLVSVDSQAKSLRHNQKLTVNCRAIQVFAYCVVALTMLVYFRNDARTQDKADIAFQLPQDPPDPKAGQLLEWEGWSFRWQFRDIEGLMLSDVYFRGRKVLKAINLAEIYVPYAPGEPRPEELADPRRPLRQLPRSQERRRRACREPIAR